MATGKNKIIVYADWIDTFDELTDEEAGKLIKHFFQYVNDNDPTPVDRLTDLLFKPIKATLKRDLKTWETKQAVNKANGAKGGRPPKPKETQINPTVILKTQANPKKGVSVSVTDSVNDIDSDMKEDSKPKITFSAPILESYERLILYFDEELRPKTEKAKENWLDTIEKLIRLDGETLENVELVTKLTREDQFWRDNFQSLNKLRKKDKDDLQYFKRFKNQLKNKHNAKPKEAGGVTPDKLREIIERHHGNGS